MTKSGLRGRGGAGFPAGRNGLGLRQAKTLYLSNVMVMRVIGAFMDGSVMEGDPYKMIRKVLMTIAAYAVSFERMDIFMFVQKLSSFCKET